MSRPWDAILSFKRARAAGGRGSAGSFRSGRLHGPDGLGALRRLIRRGRRARGQRQQSHDEEHARDPAMIDGSHSRRFSNNRTTRSPGRGGNRDAHGLRRPPRARKDCVPAGSASAHQEPELFNRMMLEKVLPIAAERPRPWGPSPAGRLVGDPHGAVLRVEPGWDVEDHDAVGGLARAQRSGREQRRAARGRLRRDGAVQDHPAGLELEVAQARRAARRCSRRRVRARRCAPHRRARAVSRSERPRAGSGRCSHPPRCPAPASGGQHPLRPPRSAAVRRPARARRAWSGPPPA